MENHRQRSLDFYAWFRKNYITLIIFLLIIYLFFAFLAPVLMKCKINQFAKIIYFIYSNFCHQFAHRSWFLFGEQFFYPAYPVGNSAIRSIENVFGITAENIDKSREIIGNENAGYKIALCQRDVAIYGAMLIFSIIYKLFKNQIRSIPLWLWFLVAIIPMSIDGFWQLFSSLNLSILNLQSYESTPLMRSITGGMFGFFTGWYLYSAIEETFLNETRGKIRKIDFIRK